MKKFFAFTLCIAALAAFAGCDDDAFLTEHPKYFYSLDNSFKTRARFEAALVTCYSMVRSMQVMSGDANTCFVYRGGNGTDMYDVASIRHNLQFNDYSLLSPERQEFRDIFSSWYSLISSANLVLYGMKDPDMVWDSEEDKAYVAAQARFFRAWAYRNLGEEFGGVPIVTDFCGEARYDFARTTRLETYQFAIDELEAILPDLPETTLERGRIVRGAAQHTLCQLYVDKGIVLDSEGRTDEAKAAWRAGIKHASALIDGGIYSLMKERFGTRKDADPVFYYANCEEDKTPAHTYGSAGVKIEGNVFWDLFQPGNQAWQDGNAESIWIVRTELDAHLEKDAESRLPYSRVFGPVFRDPQAGILDGLMEDVGGRGVCYVMPTEYARDLVYKDRFADDMRNSEAVLRRTFIGNVPGSRYYGKVIPWSVIYKDGGSVSAVQAAYSQCYPISCKISSDVYADDASGGNKSNLFRDDYVIRLAETYLLRAEAYFRLGDSNSCSKDLNAIRSRSRCGYLIRPADITIETILDERARELLYEEIRWNTLLRMGGTVAVDRIREYSYWEYPRTGTMKNFNLWPIPQSVIDTNKDVVIEQNDGWN